MLFPELELEHTGAGGRMGGEHLEFEIYMKQPRGSPKLDKYILLLSKEI